MYIDRLEVNFENKPCYDIVISDDFSNLRDELVKLDIEKKKICIVSDTNVAPLYLEAVKKELEGLNVFVHIFDAGERNKHLGTVSEIYDTLIYNKFDRKDILLALGGGVVGDICGFAAATYLRGIDFVQIPTTLLSQVDSSIGGKTGVDFKHYKNMVGAFYMPRLVYVNINTLNTLPKIEFTSGMGEVIKHGLIFDKDYYYWLFDNSEKILAGGHTLGHAIEREKEFVLSHGQCVGLGMLAAFDICIKKNKLTEGDRDFLKNLMEVYSFDTDTNIDVEKVFEATFNDKKMEAGKIKFVLLDGIGRAFIDREVSKIDMLEALNSICKRV